MHNVTMESFYRKLLPFLGYLYLLHIPFSKANRGYLVVSPSAFRPGREEVISITILEPTQPIDISAKLFAKSGDLVSSTTNEIFGKGTIKLKIPWHSSGLCTLKICGNCRTGAHGSFSFHNSTEIIILDKGVSAFIQTDKPIYKPEQNVLINVITTGADLRPVNQNILMYITDPRGSRMVQWKNLKQACCGLVNISYPLSSQPVFGKWHVIAEHEGHLYNRSFEVQKYVLPRFQVSIHPPAFIKDWNTCQPVFVRARYTYGKEVVGFMTVSVQVQGADYYEGFNSLKAAAAAEIRGMSYFNVCISELMDKGVSDHFRGVLHIETAVEAADGSLVRASDTSCAVNKHLIDIEFTKDTRSHFKPGLPYKGKLSVYYPDGSPADNVTVELRSEVDGKERITQSFVSGRGRIAFELPPFPPLTLAAWLDAKVTEVNGVAVTDNYFPVYKSVSSWYSPSNCHVLVDGNTDNLEVGDDAIFKVQSTCSCNFTMYYEVMARGNLVYSGIHFARHVQKRDTEKEEEDEDKNNVTFEENTGIIEQDDNSCTIYIKFPIYHLMSPLSRLLVYYIRPSGEGVADSLMFKVKPAFQNKVAIDLSKHHSLPGDYIQMEVKSKPDSCVCVAAVDKSVTLMKPGYRLGIDEIFHELEEYDMTVDEDPNSRYWVWAQKARSKRSMPTWQMNNARDAYFAFEETGLIVLTDSVRLRFRQEKQNDGPMFVRPPGMAQVLAHTSQRESTMKMKQRERMRTYFPETWIWTCFNISSPKKSEILNIQVPDSVTSWSIGGMALSKTHGLALAEIVHLRTFKKFFVEFSLPYAATRGEQVIIPLKVHNYLHSCARVVVKFVLPEGVFFAKPVNSDNVKSICIGRDEIKSISNILVFSEIGKHNITAIADAYGDNRCCSGFLSNATPKDRDLIGFDTVIKTTRTEAEGVKKSYTHSAFFCPNEKIHITTPNRYEFQYFKRPGNVSSFSFSVRARNDVRIVLSKLPEDNEEMFEIVLGGWSNAQSWISIGKEGTKLTNVSSKMIVNEFEYRSFWISWHDGNITVGKGHSENDSILMTCDRTKPVQAKYIGFSTGWGAQGDFRIWRKKEVGEGTGYLEFFHLNIPPNYVPNSEWGTVKVIGDVLGPSFNNLDRLVQMPAGCGEQNMIHFAPNVYVLDYLKTIKKPDHDIIDTATNYLLKGYQRQLTYRRDDGSYSAFGDQDSTGNMWLSTFVLKCFAEASKHIYIDPVEMKLTMKWIISHQRKDGSFPSLGRLINKEVQGGMQGKKSLTAYVAIALLETSSKDKGPKVAIRLAKMYLESTAETIKDPYTAALVSYALTRLGSSRAHIAHQKLSEMAIKSDGLTHWSYSGHKLLETFGVPEKATAADVEIAAYALLSMSVQGDIASALPVVKWMSKQRNTKGGFISTQDTCVAMQALSKFAVMAQTGRSNLTILVAPTNRDTHIMFNIHDSNSMLLQTEDLPLSNNGNDVIISATGDGCGFMQIDVNYNIPDPTSKSAFALYVRLGKQRIRHKNNTRRKRTIRMNSMSNEVLQDYRVTFEACTRWQHNGSSNMAIMEVTLLTGFIPDVHSLNKLLNQGRNKLKRYEIEGRKINFYFDEIQSSCLTCISFDTHREFVVGKTNPVPVKIYDYYEPNYETSTMYNGSHVGSLAQDLCEDDACNKIREDNTNIESDDCDGVYGCFVPADEAAMCTCYRECGGPADKVCSSDGEVYMNQCHMEEHACQYDVHLERMPWDYCFPEEIVLDDDSGEGPTETLQDRSESQNFPYSGEKASGSNETSSEVSVQETIVERGDSAGHSGSGNGNNETSSEGTNISDTVNLKDTAKLKIEEPPKKVTHVVRRETPAINLDYTQTTSTSAESVADEVDVIVTTVSSVEHSMNTEESQIVPNKVKIDKHKNVKSENGILKEDIFGKQQNSADNFVELNSNSNKSMFNENNNDTKDHSGHNHTFVSDGETTLKICAEDVLTTEINNSTLYFDVYTQDYTETYENTEANSEDQTGTNRTTDDNDDDGKKTLTFVRPPDGIDDQETAAKNMAMQGPQISEDTDDKSPPKTISSKKALLKKLGMSTKELERTNGHPYPLQLEKLAKYSNEVLKKSHIKNHREYYEMPQNDQAYNMEDFYQYDTLKNYQDHPEEEVSDSSDINIDHANVDEANVSDDLDNNDAIDPPSDLFPITFEDFDSSRSSEDVSVGLPQSGSDIDWIRPEDSRPLDDDYSFDWNSDVGLGDDDYYDDISWSGPIREHSSEEITNGAVTDLQPKETELDSLDDGIDITSVLNGERDLTDSELEEVLQAKNDDVEIGDSNDSNRERTSDETNDTTREIQLFDDKDVDKDIEKAQIGVSDDEIDLKDQAISNEEITRSYNRDLNKETGFNDETISESEMDLYDPEVEIELGVESDSELETDLNADGDSKPRTKLKGEHDLDTESIADLLKRIDNELARAQESVGFNPEDNSKEENLDSRLLDVLSKQTESHKKETEIDSPADHMANSEGSQP